MKLVKTVLISSLTALLFTNNVFAQQKSTLQDLANTQINLLLKESLDAIQPINTQNLIANQVDKQLLEFKTNELVKHTTNQLPKNRFKVIIAD